MVVLIQGFHLVSYKERLVDGGGGGGGGKDSHIYYNDIAFCFMVVLIQGFHLVSEVREFNRRARALSDVSGIVRKQSKL